MSTFKTIFPRVTHWMMGSDDTSNGDNPFFTHISSPYFARRKNRTYRIAIIAYSHAPALQQMIDHFKLHLEKNAPGQFSYSFFDGQANLETLISHTTQIMHSYTMDYDAILAVGSAAAQIASRMSLFLNIPMPIVFTNVINPIHTGIIYPGSGSTQNITGVAAPPFDHKEQVAMLNAIKESTRKVLLPFNPEGFLNTQSAQISHLLHSRGIEIIPVQTRTKEELDIALKKYIQDVDTLITLRDSITVNNMQKIVQTCNNYGVTVFSSDLKSVEAGAALGFAVKEESAGKKAAEYILNLFEHNAHPHELPIETQQLDYVVGINSATSKEQGLELDTEVLASLKDKIIFDKQHEHEQKKES